VQALDMSPLPVAVPQQIERMWRYLEDVSGLHEASLGRIPTGVKTGVGIAELKQADATSQDDLVDNLEDFLEEVARKLLKVIAEELRLPCEAWSAVSKCESALPPNRSAQLSQNGIDFTARPEVIGRSYMRIFQHDGMTYALTMPGTLSRSADGLGAFEAGPTLFNPNMRHAAVLKRDGALFVFWTEVGEAPERIKLSRIALAADWSAWRDEPAIEVMRPERPWEGADAPLLPSIRSTAYGRVNQLRDPAVYEEDGATYLLYAVGGESGIGLASVAFRSGARTGHPAGIVSGAQ